MSAVPTKPGETDAPFAFTEENMAEVRRILAKYPDGRERSAILPLLDLAQRQQGWISRTVVETVAEMTRSPAIHVWEVATFYTMYNLKQIGANHVQICTNLPCWLRGSDEVVKAAREVFGVGFGQTSADGTVTVSQMECLGACVNAPMMQIGDDYFEDLDFDRAKALFQSILDGRPLAPGPQTRRQTSAPEGGMSTLTTDPTTPEGGRWIAADSPAAGAGAGGAD